MKNRDGGAICGVIGLILIFLSLLEIQLVEKRKTVEKVGAADLWCKTEMEVRSEE